MPPKRRSVTILVLIAMVPLALACGGRTEEAPPATSEESAQEEMATPEEEAATPEEQGEEMAPAGEPQEEAAPEREEPEVVGNVTLAGEDLLWGDVSQESAEYTWTVRVSNDTTATLDITVTFDLLDDNDRMVKTERATVRLAPAESTTIEEPGTMTYDQASRVVGFRARYDYAVVEG